MAPSPRTLDDALRGGRSVLGEGAAALEGNAGLINRLKQVAMRVDPALDAAAINASLPDDAVHKAAKKKYAGGMDVSPSGVNVLFDRVELERQKRDKPGTLSFSNGEPSQDEQRQGLRPVSRAPKDDRSPLDQMVGTAESAFGYVALAPLATELALPALGGVAGWLGMKGVQNTLNAPGEYLNKTNLAKNVTLRQALNDGIQIGFSALQTYGVAKGFNENMKALKEMYADVTGKDPRSISTMGMLTATNLPPLIAQNRDHFIKEYGSRGLVQAVGWGLVARDLLKGKLHKPKEIVSGRIGIAAGLLPGLVNMGIDMFMGTSTTEVYSGFKKAFDTGQPIPANEYAAFILASSPDLARRRVGKQVAMEVAQDYAAQHASPGEILRQMNDGRFNAKIEGLITRDEAALAEKTAAARQQKGVARPVSMVDKLSGATQDRPKIGKFTSMVSEENKGVAPSVT